MAVGLARWELDPTSTGKHGIFSLWRNMTRKFLSRHKNFDRGRVRANLFVGAASGRRAIQEKKVAACNLQIEAS